MSKMYQYRQTKIYNWIKKEFAIPELIDTNSKFGPTLNINNCFYRVDLYPNNGKIMIINDKRLHLYYVYENNKFIFNSKITEISQEDINYHYTFMENNKRLFDIIKFIKDSGNEIYHKYHKYDRLFERTNYLLCLTFLLCNSKKKIFCRDIAKLIAQKIFFSFFSSEITKWKKLKKKKEKWRLKNWIMVN
jgi:hypothetical protein